ncbi:Hypothetical protein D9617_56g096170 [Elsinoe fawcettii]|nr:Hypothetical protein D9617_56g096170 [Elsinoe fawcettii]
MDSTSLGSAALSTPEDDVLVFLRDLKIRQLYRYLRKLESLKLISKDELRTRNNAEVRLSVASTLPINDRVPYLQQYAKLFACPNHLRLQAEYETAFAYHLQKRFEASQTILDNYVGLANQPTTYLENAIRGQIIALRVENILAWSKHEKKDLDIGYSVSVKQWLSSYPEYPTEPEARARLRLLLALYQVDTFAMSNVYLALQASVLPRG